MIKIFENLSPGSMQGEVVLMGVLLIIFAGITIFTRCAGAITEEKRMKTWDDLIMTGTRIDKIAHSKMWGILQASILYVCAYTIPLLSFQHSGRNWRDSLHDHLLHAHLACHLLCRRDWNGDFSQLLGKTSQTVKIVDLFERMLSNIDAG